MLPLKDIAAWARDRASSRVNEKSKQKGNVAKIYEAQGLLFHERLLSACRRVADDPQGVPEVGFICLPERLLSKMAYLCLGTSRKAKGSSEPPSNVPESAVALLAGYDALQKEVAFRNLETVSSFSRCKNVLVCHGLSPVGDSILLLAEIGRCARLAWVTGLPLHVMLADISWMSSNRSIRQFGTLTEDDIDTGLRVCLDKRRRFYEAIQASCDIKEIAPYERAGAISQKKLELISERYDALARTLWGRTGRLDHADIRVVSTSLDQLIFGEGTNLPDAVATIGQFPRTLAALEHELKPHLEIIRTVAKQFHSFDEEVFTYFFCQYYAQQEYRGKAIKVAPESERKFDEPFDELDQYFRAWGEGHSTSEILSGRTEPLDGEPLASAYLPQYQVGRLRLLPYTPLSLDALGLEDRDHNAVLDAVIPIDGREMELEKITSILAETPVVSRNRLLGDIFSLLQHCKRAWGDSSLDEPCASLDLGCWTDLLESGPKLLSDSAEQESSIGSPSDIKGMWTTWLKNIEVEGAEKYVPAHMYFYLLEEDSWDEDLFQFASNLVALARQVFQSVVG